MTKYYRFDKFLPPTTYEILAANLPPGSDWYEMRAGKRVMSFEVESWDDALSNGRSLQRVYPSSSLWYCWRSEDGLEEVKIL